MAIEEKLKYFYNSTMNSIKTRGDAELEKLQSDLEADFEEFKKNTIRETELEDRLHADAVKKDLLKNLSSEKLKLRRYQATREGELKEELFEEVKALLVQYRTTDDYKKLLAGMIRSAKAFAREDEVRIYLCPDDGHLKDELEKETGIPLIVSDVPFHGGLQAEIPSRNIFINNSFSSRVGEAKNAYIMKA